MCGSKERRRGGEVERRRSGEEEKWRGGEVERRRGGEEERGYSNIIKISNNVYSQLRTDHFNSQLSIACPPKPS